MTVTVRLSGPLARLAGTSRLVVTLEAGSTIATLIESLGAHHPGLTARLRHAVAVVEGRTVSSSLPLSDGQEVAFLIPVAGGSHRAGIFQPPLTPLPL